jgi:hypothetical protein
MPKYTKNRPQLPYTKTVILDRIARGESPPFVTLVVGAWPEDCVAFAGSCLDRVGATLCAPDRAREPSEYDLAALKHAKGINVWGENVPFALLIKWALAAGKHCEHVSIWHGECMGVASLREIVDAVREAA